MEDENEEFGEEQNEESTLLCILQDDITEVGEVSALISEYAKKYLCKVPCRTSEQIGHSWLQEVLKGHPNHSFQQFRMEKHVFYQFCTEIFKHGLRRTK